MFMPIFQTEMLAQEKLGNFLTFLSMTDSQKLVNILEWLLKTTEMT